MSIAPAPATPGGYGPLLKDTLPHIRVAHYRPRVLGYERQHFGHGWAATEAGCTTRTDIMADTFDNATTDTDCRVDGGHAICPYTGDIISTSRVDVDHIYPLSAAWDMGAAQWDASRRIAFANDPRNLVVVTSATNRDKGDQLPAEWMPPHPAAHCWYASRVAHIAAEYDLALTDDDLAVMMAACRVRELTDGRLG